MPDDLARLAGEIAAIVESDYEVDGPLTGRFLASGFNDQYRVEPEGPEREGPEREGPEREGPEREGTAYHVRLYLEGKYYIAGDDDLEFELEAVDALAGAGCPVARPVRRRDGGLLTRATIDGRPRRLAAFEIAPGEVNRRPGPDAAERLGAAVADLHGAADRLVPSGSRYHLDERYLLAEPVRLLGDLAGETAEVDAIGELAAGLFRMLAGMSRTPPAYGLIHADLHLGNMLFVPDGSFTILDFDHCAFGWRAYDLAPLRASFDDESWGRVLAGYESRAPLPAGTDRIDDFLRLRMLWDVGDLLAMQPVWGTTQVGRDILADLGGLVARLGLAPLPAGAEAPDRSS